MKNKQTKSKTQKHSLTEINCKCSTERKTAPQRMPGIWGRSNVTVSVSQVEILWREGLEELQGMGKRAARKWSQK